MEVAIALAGCVVSMFPFKIKDQNSGARFLWQCTEKRSQPRHLEGRLTRPFKDLRSFRYPFWQKEN